MSHKSEYTMSAQELIQETIRLRALEKQFTKERGELMARNRELEAESKQFQSLHTAALAAFHREIDLRNGSEARLAAVLGAGQLAWDYIHQIDDPIPGNIALGLANWNALLSARTGDAAHPDSVKLAAVIEAAQAVVARWETPRWKDAEPTAAVIYRLRDAIRAQ